jgi:hypothetical protein
MFNGVADLAAHENPTGNRGHGQLGDERRIRQDLAHLEAPVDDRVDNERPRRDIPPQKIGNINNKRRSFHEYPPSV